MSELEKREGLSRYDSMPTEELQEILLKHLNGELETEPDTQDLFEIMEVLSKRRKTENPQAFRSNEEAFAEFVAYYMPKETEKPAQPKRSILSSRLLRTAAAVLAIVLLLTLGTTVTAKAFNFDIWGKFAIWTKEFFHFTDDSSINDPKPDKEHSIEYNQLREILAEYKIDESIMPSWLPDRYKHKDITVVSSPFERSIVAIYERDNVELVIQIRQIVGKIPEQIEKNDSLLEVYTANNVNYYIFSNTETLQVAWVIGESECQIIGKITIEEIKAMIDSI